MLLLQIVFEGVVGKNSLGNIAIDDVSMIPGVCPSEENRFRKKCEITKNLNCRNVKLKEILQYQQVKLWR